ncbi:Similar to S.cerevisiae protein KIN1 (Serine/threonine protein kinase involved in regulation of exocytosis) [Malassezia sympodialis ATCC 42132]|mgnify:CR=1 FL=1|uniref:non-specific serine/threonine protein kinase n=1 Tax=Malassezia sympodialis (strain ATCC 42132) TaxID=1230383 RepID=A0A1M8A1V2_MALS4|nr:Similar to S.cerevisiae protein KIN1 (Serine/threonine protein kinase involved in regulation of exocytosis) [Malassezia sympodialis ATCC 42132]
MAHHPSPGQGDSCLSDSLVVDDGYGYVPPPPLTIPSNSVQSTPTGKVDLGYLASTGQSSTSSHRRPSSPLRPVKPDQTTTSDMSNTGLVDPEALGALSPVPPTSTPSAPPAVSATVSRSNTHPRHRLPQPSPSTLQDAFVPVTKPPPTETVSNSLHEEQLRWTLGDYMVGRTIGAGSMGKVKYGICKSDQRKVAVKIIPRHTSVTGVLQHGRGKPKHPSHAATEAEMNAALSRAASRDASKEVRIVREGSLQMLLMHPYICRMREMIVHTNHYYMIFEHINGGQMLDYIISHGRLRERSARSFARQIGSALQYCHANNIVHRDLKIENILISKSGNIKIIDFGLSNLFSPQGHLNTFCGSLYFAAPELLNARVYTGPEVDVWSFGVVLFVLVCGKVPFDDPSMPVLHQRIKSGIVEYPAWLSSECKHLLSIMLVTNPHQRASMQEVMSHPWMMKGYDQPEPTYLPERVPLRAGHLDRNVIERMTGFEFGPPDHIEQQLEVILRSDAYLNAVAHHDRLGDPALDEAPASATASRHRMSLPLGLPFYRRKKDSDDLVDSNGPPGIKGPVHPAYGFHPLISVYFLVREKMEREAIGMENLHSSDLLDRPNTAQPSHSLSAQINNVLVPPEDAAITVTEVATLEAHSLPTSPAPLDIPNPTLRLPEKSLVSSRATDVNVSPVLHSPVHAQSFAPPESDSLPTPVFESRQKSQPHGLMKGPPRPRAKVEELENKLLTSSIQEAKIRRSSTLSRPNALQRSVSMHHTQQNDLQPRAFSSGAARPLPSLSTIQSECAVSCKSSQSISPETETRSMPPATPEQGLSHRLGSMSVKTPVQSTLPTGDLGNMQEPGRDTPTSMASLSSPVADLPVSPPMGDEATSKPVFLKGLFSVQTTSRRPRAVIRCDLVRVLELYGIQHKEIHGGFECIFRGQLCDMELPSSSSSPTGQAVHETTLTSHTPQGDKDVSSLIPQDVNELVATGVGDVDIFRSTGAPDPVSLAPPPEVNAPTKRESATMSSTDVEVCFEVFVVKVPLLLGINGLQFHRVSGNPWQYQTLAKRILNELHL